MKVHGCVWPAGEADDYHGVYLRRQDMKRWGDMFIGVILERRDLR
jgi:hypothetical protein